MILAATESESSAKEPHFTATEPYISAKEPVIFAKKTDPARSSIMPLACYQESPCVSM